MNLKNTFKNVIAAIAAFALIFGFVAPASAHETDCPYCKLPVVQDTKDLDNEVVLRLGNKRIEFRCVMCAVAQAKTKYKSRDITILAPSNVKGKPVTITKKGDEWSMTPTTAVFVFAKGSHSECQDRYRALLEKNDFNAYVAKKGYKDAQQLSLKELVELSK
ncbi:MAG TPA: hypothetical protein VEX38_06750 [Fimbriimonadaceae bacterium]|nr:hypothetical protein [Fimbriimonadaceae bacterium]